MKMKFPKGHRELSVICSDITEEKIADLINATNKSSKQLISFWAPHTFSLVVYLSLVNIYIYIYIYMWCLQ